ncbi:50S ribosomal protein L10 [Candidatus Peregrinibacteria bacterium CG_4_10_14_0_2_um_filter_38_24]|nr:MAG: 50S ribosomal protein L10 [Candidatus Peregrinibacteria bacterium CG_4_10_14_0_2_um_filter_38_24]PJC38508.1 MAG: 50S ribosomal protein L10 [Candidatus Peregrinibacteria bacterium CG_4_9_14_0_2_um_filter_38_9]
MSQTKDEKEKVLSDLQNQFKSAKAVVFADYQGLSVKDLKNLRTKLREGGVSFNVAKKTLLKLAAKDSGYDEIPDSVMEGPVGVAFSSQEEVAGAAKIIHDFSKKNKALKLRGSLFEGKILSVVETKQLAVLPSKQELLTQLVYLFNSPISGFARVIQAIADKQGQPA